MRKYYNGFDQPKNLSNENLRKIIQFYLLECPVEGRSQRGLTFNQYGYIGPSSFSKLKKALIASATSSLKNNYYPSKKEELVDNYNKVENVGFPDEYCVFLKSDEKSVIRSMFSAIRNAIAHGSFNVKSYNRTRVYFFSNFDKYKKAQIVLYESTLLEWIKIVKKETYNASI